jgi:DNA-binding NarL/FixJ family response regulator
VRRIRVLIADDHALMREGVKALLAATFDLDVVGEAEDGDDAIEETRRLDPDVVLMDVAMPGLGGLEATLAIRKEKPETKILVLTQYGDREYVSRFLKAGVSGYVLKKAAASELVSAIRAAYRGGLVLDPTIAREVVGNGESGSTADAAAIPTTVSPIARSKF